MKAILIFIIWIIGIYVLNLNHETNQKHNITLGIIGWICAVIIPITFFINFF